MYLPKYTTTILHIIICSQFTLKQWCSTRCTTGAIDKKLGMIDGFIYIYNKQAVVEYRKGIMY